MKKRFIVLSFMLCLLIVITLLNLVYFVNTFDNIQKTFPTSHVTSQGRIVLYVEGNGSEPEPEPSSSGGGGGGGSSAPKEENVGFDLSEKEFNVLVPSGNTDFQQFSIKNIGDSELVLDLELSGLKGLAFLNKDKVTLKPGAEENILVTLMAPQPGIYSGRIVVKTGNIEEELLISLNVQSEKSLFDASVSLPESSRVIIEGGILNAFISLLQVGEAEEVDVTVNYVIKNFDGELIYSESETFRVYEEKSFVKDFSLIGFPPGNYLVGIEVIYPDGFATSSSHFAVESEEKRDFIPLITIILSIFVIIAIVISVIRYKRTRLVKRKRR